jgi:hypothetical protein
MSSLLDRSGFELSALRFEPELKSAFESDYWEEFSEVNITGSFAPYAGLKLSKGQKRGRSNNKVGDSSGSSATNGNGTKTEMAEDDNADTESYEEPEVN